MLIRNISIILHLSFLLLALTNCCTTKNELKDESMKNSAANLERPPSPGNAEIKCTVEDIYDRGKKSYCKIKVSSVLNYGSGTRPIGNASMIEIEFENGTKTPLEMLMKNRQVAEMLISEVPGGMGMENRSSYRLIKIIK